MINVNVGSFYKTRDLEDKGIALGLFTDGMVSQTFGEAVPASEDKPIAQMQLYQKFGDGWVRTDELIAMPLDMIDQIDELRVPKAGVFPSRKASTIFVTATDSKEGIVEAIVNVFGIIDDGNDVVWQGAFKKTLRERGSRIRVLDQHRTDSTLAVVGKMLDAKELTRAELPPQVLARYPKATGGLWTKTQYLLSTPEGAGVFNRIDTGAIDEYSIGYDPVVYDFSEVTLEDGSKTMVRNLRGIRLWEYSPVIWGMNPATMTTGVKRHTGKEMTPQGPMRRLGDVLSGLARYSVDCYTNDLMIGGMLNNDQREEIADAFAAAMTTLNDELPEELANFSMSIPSFGYYMDGGDPDEDKAGRVLSQANYDKLQAAMDQIQSVLASAYVEEDDDKSGKPDKGESQNALSDGLVNRIEAELLELRYLRG